MGGGVIVIVIIVIIYSSSSVMRLGVDWYVVFLYTFSIFLELDIYIKLLIVLFIS